MHRRDNVENNKAASLLVELKYIEYLYTEKYVSIMCAKFTMHDWISPTLDYRIRLMHAIRCSSSPRSTQVKLPSDNAQLSLLAISVKSH